MSWLRLHSYMIMGHCVVGRLGNWGSPMMITWGTWAWPRVRVVVGFLVIVGFRGVRGVMCPMIRGGSWCHWGHRMVRCWCSLLEKGWVCHRVGHWMLGHSPRYELQWRLGHPRNRRLHWGHRGYRSRHRCNGV